MKQVYSGTGVNTTANVLSYLHNTTSPMIRNLYIIGRPENPYAIFLTDHEAPVTYNLYPQKKFAPAVVTRGDISCKIGLDAQSMTLTWSPGPGPYSNTAIATADPKYLAQQGYFDSWPVLNLWAFMPTPGDVNTLGCTVGWGGVISQTTVDRKQITFEVESLLYALDQKVPTNVIEIANQLASYQGAAPPVGFTTVPQFTTFTGSTDTVIYGDVLPPYGTNHIFTTHVFQRGYIYFIDGPGATLANVWSAVADNSEFTDGHSNNHNQFTLYTPLPWPPTPWTGSSGDQFIVSATNPINQADGNYYGFPYVPAPVQAV